MTGETVRAEEIVLKAPDGRSVTALVNATPILSEEEVVESVVISIQDLTPLEDLERLRAEFLGMVSHELRTPLAAIKGSADTLLENAPDLDPAEMTQFFRIIRDQSESMRHLIGDLLDVARIETGTLPVFPEPVEVTVLVDEARSRFQVGGGRSNLVIDLPARLPRVAADRRRVVQVLTNLLLQRGPPLPRAVSHPGLRRAGWGPTWPSRWPTTGWGCPPSTCPTCSASSRSWTERSGYGSWAGPGWGWPSARGSWRPTGAASGPRATVLGWAAGSPFTPAGGGRARQARRPAAPAQEAQGAGAGAHPVRGRRPPDPALRAGRPDPGGLRPRGHRGPGGGPPADGGGAAPPGAAGPGAAGRRRHRADGTGPGDSRRAGDLPVGLRPGRGDRPGLRRGSDRLRGQALLAHGAGGPHPGGPAPAGGSGAGGARPPPTCGES